jgi:FixJ family two-component response regulator
MKLVCVVDDEIQVRKSLANLLRSAGYQVMCFASGEAFLATSLTSRTLALVLDMHMFGLQGTDVLCRLRAAGSDLPVIGMSADSNEVTAQHALQHGACAFLLKPFAAEALLSVLAKLELDRA